MVDPRPEIGCGKDGWTIWLIDGDIGNSKPSHDDQGCPVGNQSKMAPKHIKNISYTYSENNVTGVFVGLYGKQRVMEV